MATKITQTQVGPYTDGRMVNCYKLEDEKGQYITVINKGCIIVDMCVLDKNGDLRDVNLGLPSPESYLTNNGFMGATIGRCANRIARGTFTINGVEHHVDCNDRGGINHLHGGKTGFQMRYWDAQIEDDGILFTYESADGEEGYPGNLKVTEKVTFADGKVTLKTTSTCDADTIVNYTNHAFINVNGQGTGDTLGISLQINAEKYSTTDDLLIPVGEAPVDGTPFDFRTPHTVGERIFSDFPAVKDANGYDVNYILTKESDLAATAIGNESGIRMDVYTNSPCMQFFSGFGLGFMEGGKNGAKYVNYGGFCLEPHALPDAINTDKADQVLLRKGEVKEWYMTWAFSVEK